MPRNNNIQLIKYTNMIKKKSYKDISNSLKTFIPAETKIRPSVRLSLLIRPTVSAKI